MNAFTHYWKNESWGYNSKCEGRRLNHTAGNEFKKRGVKPRDTIYIVTAFDGKMFLAGRLTVVRFVSHAKAEKELGGGLWKASEHIIGEDGTALRLRRVVPDKIVERLRFGENKPLILQSGKRLHKQTLRGVRRLTQQSAALLDQLLSNDESQRRLGRPAKEVIRELRAKHKLPSI